MSALEIPRKYEHGFVIAKSFSDTDIEQILEVLKAASPANEPSDILPNLRPRLPEVPETDLLEFLEALYSLYLFRSHSDVPVDEFVGDLSDAIRRSENKDLRTTDPEGLAVLEGRFKSLLTVRPLSTISKAHGLRTDFANIFLDAKVISDIRPVWDGNVKDPPEGVVITQTLKLEYSDVRGAEELYLCMEKEDIELLISVLKRAKQKAATLESLTHEGWMRILDK